LGDVSGTGALIEQFFGDLSEQVLHEVQRGRSWAEVLGGVPSVVWSVASTARLPALAAVIGLREHWRREQQWRPAAAATRGLVQLLSERLGAEHPDTLTELAALGQLAAASGHDERARSLLDQAWRGLHAAPWGRRLPIAQSYLRLLLDQGALGQAHAVALTCWQGTRDSSAALRTGQWLAEVLIRQERDGEALDLLLQAWASGAEAGAERLRCAEVLVRVARRAGRAGEALPAARALVAAAPDPERQAEARVRLVELLEQVGADEEALRTAEEVLRWTRSVGVQHPAFSARATLVARLRWGRGQLDEAETLLREALEFERRQFGDRSPQVARRYHSLGRLASRTGRLDEALGWLDPAWHLLASEGTSEEARAVAEDLLAVLEAWGRQAGDDRELVAHGVHRIEVVAAAAGLGGHGAVSWARRALRG
jgi:tetratricopeptide (TPR) repeat protein